MYVDGFLLPVAKSKLPAYRKLAVQAGKIWKKHGALDYKECVGDDLNHKKMFNSFADASKGKKTDVVIFSYILFKSRAHRDKVNKLVMKDMEKKMKDMEMPFDCSNMFYGGFKVLVDAK